MPQDSDQAKRLHLAATSGDAARVCKFIETKPQLIQGQSVLDAAWSDRGRRRGSQDDVVECIWLLVQHGASFESLSAATLDSALRYFPRAAAILLARGANPNVTNSVGATVLHRMAKIGNRSAADLLLQHHIDINAETNQGATPLDVAVQCGHLRMCQFLHERGAKTSLHTFKPQAIPPAAQAITVAVDDEQLLGEICWFDPKNWGYLKNEIYGDLFLGIDQLKGEIPDSIEESDFATFFVARDQHGLYAANVEVTKPTS